MWVLVQHSRREERTGYYILSHTRPENLLQWSEPTPSGTGSFGDRIFDRKVRLLAGGAEVYCSDGPQVSELADDPTYGEGSIGQLGVQTKKP